MTKLISIKDLETVENIAESYPVGRVVRVAFNTASRLSLKKGVINAVDGDGRKDSIALIKSFSKLYQTAMSNLKIKIGMEVQAAVKLVKDYGFIMSVEGLSDELAGFLPNEQLATSKQYKVGA